MRQIPQFIYFYLIQQPNTAFKQRLLVLVGILFEIVKISKICQTSVAFYPLFVVRVTTNFGENKGSILGPPAPTND